MPFRDMFQEILRILLIPSVKEFTQLCFVFSFFLGTRIVREDGRRRHVGAAAALATATGKDLIVDSFHCTTVVFEWIPFFLSAWQSSANNSRVQSQLLIRTASRIALHMMREVNIR